MAPAKQAAVPACQICSEQPSKYRCSTCPVRYCSVKCYKEHKTQCSGATNQPAAGTTAPAPSLESPSSSDPSNPEAQSTPHPPSEPKPKPLRPLTSLSWPPEPDPGIFTDPLLKDDPKPLRREELLRIAQSPSLRALLATSLPPILRLLDTLPPNARHATLSRILGLDPTSLSRPGSTSLLSGRDSPPPLEDLLGALSGQTKEEAREGEEGGWWLTGPEARIWIGAKERELMRLFAGSVCMAIDGKEEKGKVVFGQGELEWEV
ncbi:hypothetical protein IAT38_002666 [Cryptococcus sp. DSM 104549]